MTVNAISWRETCPGFYKVTSQPVRVSSHARGWRPSPIAPPAGVIVAKITEVQWCDAPEPKDPSARIYTSDLVDDDDVKILSWARIFRGEIQPCYLEWNGALCLDAEVDYVRAEMTFMAKDGHWYTSPVDVGGDLPDPGETHVPMRLSISVLADIHPRSRLPTVTLLPPSLVTSPGSDSTVYEDAEDLIDHVHRIGMEHEGLNVKTAAARSPVAVQVVTWRGDSKVL